MKSLLWIVCLLLGVPAGLLAVLGWLSFFVFLFYSWRGHKGSHSFIAPYLYGVAGALACLACPLPGVWHWSWAALLLDPCIGLLFVASILHLVGRFVGWPSPFDRETPHPPDGHPKA